MDCIVHGVTKSQAQLSHLHFQSSSTEKKKGQFPTLRPVEASSVPLYITLFILCKFCALINAQTKTQFLQVTLSSSHYLVSNNTSHAT